MSLSELTSGIAAAMDAAKANLAEVNAKIDAKKARRFCAFLFKYYPKKTGNTIKLLAIKQFRITRIA